MIISLTDVNLIVIRKLLLNYFISFPQFLFLFFFVDDVLLQMEVTEEIINELRRGFREIILHNSHSCTEDEVIIIISLTSLLLFSSFHF
jgi:hypothetical protein